MLYYIRLCFTSINRSPLWLWLRTCCVVPRHVTKVQIKKSTTHCIVQSFRKHYTDYRNRFLILCVIKQLEQCNLSFLFDVLKLYKMWCFRRRLGYSFWTIIFYLVHWYCFSGCWLLCLRYGWTFFTLLYSVKRQANDGCCQQNQPQQNNDNDEGHFELVTCSTCRMSWNKSFENEQKRLALYLFCLKF